ncbi:hypothetical protein [Halobacterium salinarum]|uniref:hypothetical protein n=1 Tax=Halobacterium salinarum TaxID=2242 RepID=UPI002555CF38|nr:hypothetical protein [Halobacterium salinarum]MDL0127100.1 hypothetical protein [Halobacterium salinarum]MDL0133564.1 hypothetical protein [Halobacterium salinarum]
MYDHTALDWLVPSQEWDRFCRFVEESNGSLDGYLGDAVEDAMAEYAHIDEYAAIEERVDKLVTAAGRRPGDGFKEKNSGLLEDWADTDKTRVTVKIERDVKAKFREVASDSNHAFGVEFARAIRTYRNGGRCDRVERKLDRVLDDATNLLSEAVDDGGDEESESMSLAERKTVSIIDDLNEQGIVDQFTDDDLRASIERAADVSSEPSIEKYRSRVTDRLEMERHPNAPHIWVTHGYADQISNGEPQVIRQSTDRLDRDERVRRIRLAVGRAAAARSSGNVRVESTTLQDAVLDGDVSRQTTLSLMRAATLPAGITVDDDVSPKALDVDMGMVAQVDPDLAGDIIDYRDETSSGLLDGPTASTISDHMQSPSTGSASESPAFSDGGTKSRSPDWLGSPGYDSGSESDDGGGGGSE